MLTTTLPRTLDSTWLMSFWLAAWGLAGTLAAAVVLLLGGGARGAVAALAVAGLATVVGLQWRRAVILAYRLWNDVARAGSRFARRWILAVCYYGLLPLVGRAGSRLSIEPAGRGASWSERPPAGGRDPAASLHDGGPLRSEPRGGWRWLASWTLHDGRAWVLFLLPFLLLLRYLEPEPQEPPPADLYTLY